MNTTLKSKLHDYEVSPPDQIWDQISTKITPTKIINIRPSTSQFSYTLVAASILLFIIASVFLQIRPSEEKNSTFQTAQAIAFKDSIGKNNDGSSTVNKVNNIPYVTLEGPLGKIKVSEKVAALIIAPETPSKKQWNKKLVHWKNIMMTASNTNFMDVITLTQSAETENLY